MQKFLLNMMALFACACLPTVAAWADGEQDTETERQKKVIILRSDGCSREDTLVCWKGTIVHLIADTTLYGNHFFSWDDGVRTARRDVDTETLQTDTLILTAYFGIALDDEVDNSNLLRVIDTIHTTHERNILLKDRVLQADMWNTLTLPFALPTLEGTPLEEAEVLTYSSASTDAQLGLALQFSRTTSMQAGVPYLVKPATTLAANHIFFEDVIIDTLTYIQGADQSVSFMPALHPTTLVAGQTNIFVGANNQLYYPSASGTQGTKMKGMRAYFRVNSQSQAPAYILIEDDELGTDLTTSLAEIIEADAPVKVLQNGRLYILHAGAVYDIQGRRIQ